MTAADAISQPALWPLTAILFIPAVVAAFLSLPIIPKAREEAVREDGDPRLLGTHADGAGGQAPSAARRRVGAREHGDHLVARGDQPPQ